MKILLTFLLISGLVSASLQAQEINETPKININRTGFGAFVGLNHSYPILSLREPIHIKPQDNLVVGLDLRYTLNKRTSLHLQPTWLQSRNVRSEAWSDPEIIYSLTTLKLPLVCRYYIPDQKLFFIQAGASYNYLLASNFSKSADIECLTAPCPVFYYTAAPANKSTVSALAGFGFNIEVQKMSIPIVLQYERSVSSYNFPLGDATPTTPLTFHNIALTTGISF